MKTLKNYKGYTLYVLLCVFLCVGCGSKRKINKLEQEFKDKKELCEYYKDRYDQSNNEYEKRTLIYKHNECTKEMIDIVYELNLLR